MLHVLKSRIIEFNTLHIITKGMKDYEKELG